MRSNHSSHHEHVAHSNYAKLAVELIVDFVIMYFVMYTMIATVDQGEADNGEAELVIDGHARAAMVVPLIDDLQVHQMSVMLRFKRQMAPG